jgi:hypothetical protein
LNAIPRFALATVLLCTMMAAQAGAAAPSAKTRKPAAAAVRSECVAAVGLDPGAPTTDAPATPLCISVPAAWQRLGNIFDDLGFVAAEPHAGADPESWPHLTVAVVDISAKEDRSKTEDDSKTEPAAAAPSLDALVERMLAGGGALASAHVLERSSLLVNRANAQIVRVGLPEEAGHAEAIETVALIEGEDGMVYSIALHCSPPDFKRLEPVFRQAVESWHLQGGEAKSAPPHAASPSPTARSPKHDPAGSAKIKP